MTSARQSIPALNAADDAYATWAGSPAAQISHSAPAAVYRAWVMERDTLLVAVAVADAEEAAKTLLCTKCNGHGTLGDYQHRHGGTCYQCKGDGWTAKGRKQQRVEVCA